MTPAVTMIRSGWTATPRLRASQWANARRSSGAPCGSAYPNSRSVAVASTWRSARSHAARGNALRSGAPAEMFNNGRPEASPGAPSPTVGEVRVAATTVPPPRFVTTSPSSASLRYASTTVPRATERSSASTRVAGNRASGARVPSAMALRSRSTSQLVRPRAGAVDGSR